MTCNRTSGNIKGPWKILEILGVREKHHGQSYVSRLKFGEEYFNVFNLIVDNEHTARTEIGICRVASS